MPGRLNLKSVDEYVAIAAGRLQGGAKGAGLAIALLVIGALGVVVFLMVALLSRSWGFSFSGIFFSLLIAAGGAWLLIRPE